MSLSILSKTPSLCLSFIFSCIPASALKKKMVTVVASTSPTHISPLNRFQSPETNIPLSLVENCNSMDQLKQIHLQAIRKGLASDSIIHFKMIAFCCTHESGCLNYARYLFDTIPQPNLYIWNTMIKGYSRINCPQYAVSMYKEMLEKSVKPDHYTFPFLLNGFTSEVALQCGKPIHAHVWKLGFDSNVFVQNGLIRVYSVCFQIDSARGVFDVSSKTDVVTWNTMISGCNRSELFEESMKLFYAMEKRVLPTSVTLVSVLSTSSKLKDLDAGKRVHQYVTSGKVEPNLTLENALIDIEVECLLRRSS
ncbi:hypothetical protein U1Q18_006761 [Sarracenia purpurea var. burkii]